MAAAPQEPRKEWSWRCLHCHGPLSSDARGLRCAGCGKDYPAIAGIPILVREPVGYLRSELAALARSYHDARERRDSLERLASAAGLPDASLDRHRDILDAEITRAEMFLALLEPAAAALTYDRAEMQGVRPSGWALDALLPYLLRDWTSTAELEAASARISAALMHVFPDPSGKSLVFAACGAGGLLAESLPNFERVLGFDLTLPVLAAARRLLDGESLDLALPRAINACGGMILRKRDQQSTSSPIELVAMDALDTAFADGSIDCVVTSFLIDLIPDPRRLAHEIHRILSPDGVWINYGPSGTLRALWRFDQTEISAFLETAGFAVLSTEAYRATYLDLSRDCPSWSFQNHICYLTSARKAGVGRGASVVTRPDAEEIPNIIPQHFPGANLVQRRRLGAQQTRTTHLRHEAVPGQVKSFEIGDTDARIMAFIDGKRTVNEIADLLKRETPSQSSDDTIHTFVRYFEQGLLNWRRL